MSSYDNEIVQRIIKETIDMENLLCELTGEGESDTAREMRSVHFVPELTNLFLIPYTLAIKL